MAADQPLTVYRKEPERNPDGSRKHTKEEMDDLWNRWVERKKREGSMVGKKVNLAEWLNSGAEAPEC